MAITKTLDFLHRRMESSKTISEKEDILELILLEGKDILKRNSYEDLKHYRSILHTIAVKYFDDYQEQ